MQTYERFDGLHQSVVMGCAYYLDRHFLTEGEYKSGITKKEYCFLHHTAGWQNPYRTVDHWGRDSRGAVATEFVLGGQSIKGNDETYDGVQKH